MAPPEPITRTPNKIYLGDGAYVDLDPELGVKLTSEDGIHVLNVVYIQQEDMDRLIQWWKKLNGAL